MREREATIYAEAQAEGFPHATMTSWFRADGTIAPITPLPGQADQQQQPVPVPLPQPVPHLHPPSQATQQFAPPQLPQQPEGYVPAQPPAVQQPPPRRVIIDWGNYTDISERGKWSVSSYKFGFGSECLRDEDGETFWQ